LSQPRAGVRILVDADGCPVRREAGRVAARLGIEQLLFTNSSQEIADPPHGRVIVVSDRRDATDFAIFSECRPGDVVVTDDLGLAAMVLARDARALSSRGRRCTPEEMPARLETRHAARMARRAGRRIPGPRPFTPADRRRFTRALESLLTTPSGPPAPPSGSDSNQEAPNE